ncbi:MAG TPA: helix-turn-helix domain-containing protein [Candidatus Limnocylindria bacterium]|nr:helix-turn-helix domain-containing protein [Candidatus Limnocylindria bacterium]
MNAQATRARRVIVVDNSHVARRIGERIRQARTRIGLTQAQLAKGRYTAAYISALERGLAKPSMAALTFLSERLGVSVPDLVAEERPAASRLEADLLLAAGKHQEALDRYDALLDAAGDDRRNRAELLRGRSEALCRLDRGKEAIAAASEAAELFDAMAATADAALARYWLAGAHYQADNPAEARGILEQLLADDRAGLDVAPDFRFRLLAQLGNVEAWDGKTDRAMAYMEEARTLTGTVSLQQRAAFLSGLALQYRRTGDLERSLRVGHEAMAIYQSANTEREVAALEINLALAFVELGNLERAAGHLADAAAIAERYGDTRLEADVAEAQAQLAFARGDESLARQNAIGAVEAHGRGGSYLAAVGGHLTLARIARSRGDASEAEEAYRQAGDLLRANAATTRLRDVLVEWAGLRSELGDHVGANELYVAAIGRGSGATSRL